MLDPALATPAWSTRPGSSATRSYRSLPGSNRITLDTDLPPVPCPPSTYTAPAADTALTSTRASGDGCSRRQRPADRGDGLRPRMCRASGLQGAADELLSRPSSSRMLGPG